MIMDPRKFQKYLSLKDKEDSRFCLQFREGYVELQVVEIRRFSGIARLTTEASLLGSTSAMPRPYRLVDRDMHLVTFQLSIEKRKPLPKGIFAMVIPDPAVVALGVSVTPLFLSSDYVGEIRSTVTSARRMELGVGVVVARLMFMGSIYERVTPAKKKAALKEPTVEEKKEGEKDVSKANSSRSKE